MIRYYSPLRYPGGKAKIAPMIIAILQQLHGTIRTYIEPFAGGAGVAIKLLLEGHVDHIVINDWDKAIYSFWRAVKECPDRVIEFIMTVPLTIEEWRSQRRAYLENNGRYSFELGMAAFFLNRTNRSGILNGGPIGGKAQRPGHNMSARFNREALAKRIHRIAEQRERIKIYNQEIRTFIRRILPRFTSKSFVYFDPPYYEKGQRLYKNALGAEDHRQIAEMIMCEVECPWLVTYDNVSVLREIYDAFPQYCYSLQYTVSDRRLGNELAIFQSEDIVPIEASAFGLSECLPLETL